MKSHVGPQVRTIFDAICYYKYYQMKNDRIMLQSRIMTLKVISKLHDSKIPSTTTHLQVSTLLLLFYLTNNQCLQLQNLSNTNLYMTSLQQHLNQYIFSSSSNQQLISIIKKQLKTSITPNLLESRSDSIYSEKQLQRINGFRYAQGYKICQKTSNPNLLFRNLDYIVNTQGLTLNTGAFLVTIQLLGDEEQVKYWREQVFSGKALGGYGQTEMGHGSNVKQLQTIAIYNEQKQAFIINSPTITSAKFWPGNLGQYATHSVVQAKTIVKGKSIGLQTFVTQIRDNNLQAIKNVEAFDIGPKLGFQRVDNGGLIFRNLQIPRKAMLMRYIKVNKDGVVEGLQNKSAEKYGYGSMLNLRVQLTYMFAMQTLVYPAVHLYALFKKKQIDSAPQNKKFVINSLCLGYGIMIANNNTKSIFNNFLTEIGKQNYPQADKHLINCHIISSTFKAVSSRIGLDVCSSMLTYDELAKFKSSFLPFHLFSLIPSTTYQGDNTVLLQQTAKFLFFKFDTDKDFSKVSKEFKSNDWISASRAIQSIIAWKLKILKKRLEEFSEKGLSFQTIWNEKIQLGLIQVSTIWGYMTFLKSIQIILPTIKENVQFYRKICQSFTSSIISRIHELQMHDFKIEQVEVWKQFSEQEFKGLLQINTPIEREYEPFDFYERPGNWIHARL